MSQYSYPTSSNFQPSPYQIQTPEFSNSPLDQIGNSIQAGPSSRGALIQRAFTLTRKSSVKRSKDPQTSSVETRRDRDYFNVGYNNNVPNDEEKGKRYQQGLVAQQHSLGQPGLIDQANNHQQFDKSGKMAEKWGQGQQHYYQQPYGQKGITQIQMRDERDQGFNGAVINSSSDGNGIGTDPQTPNFTSSTSSLIEEGGKDKSRYSISDYVQKQRAARLSQQQFDIDQHNRNRESQMTIRSPPPQSTNLHSNQIETNQSNQSLSNAFRDSVASNISFNSLTGPEERSSMMLLNQNSFGSGGGVDEFANDSDRIAQEVRGLAMRRRPSLDTVRSSEFGENGRWAKAWAGSDDGDEDEEEDEMDLQAMRTRQMSDFDIESRNQKSALGALGELGNFQGVRAAINKGEEVDRDVKNDHGKVLNSSQAHNVKFPQLHDVTSALHTVSLTSSSRKGDQLSNESQPQSSSYLTSHAQPRSDLTRRDTIMSVAGEIGQISSTDPYHDHARSNSTASVSTIQDNNQHVKIWPPTPAGSETSTSNHNTRLGRSDTLRAIPHIGFGQSAKIESMDQHVNQDQEMSNKPISPSTLLSQTDQIRNEDVNVYRPSAEGMPFTGYGDPNEYSFYAPPESFGKARQKAIADHDGRESLVSDLDVETLRLDGSSVAGGSQDEWDSRRGSTSTLGTVDSAILSEQRRRRSRMENQEAQNFYVPSSEVDIERSTSSATIRGGSRYSQGLNEGIHRPSQSHLQQNKRNVSNPNQTIKIGNTVYPIPPQPRRSNTLPDEQQLSIQNQPSSVQFKQQANYTPNLAPAPWARNNVNQSPSIIQQSNNQQTLSPSTRSTSLASMNGTMNTSTSKRTSNSNPIVQSEAEKFLTLGISHHESGDLSRSAFYFERSAKVEGGCVVGMCMWGMALREGWGIRKDQKRGFEWISRAASKAGDLMSSNNGIKARSEFELKAIRSELKLSVYELGKCFCYGWGVKQDRQMALEYFELAAKLGDSDAQAEAGALLAAGKGCKKDLKKAAMYYRMAEAQGYDTVGLSWIHKDKYDPVPAATATTTSPIRTKSGK